MGNYKILNRIMIYDVYLRQLVTLAVKKRPEYVKNTKKEKRSSIQVVPISE